MSAYDAAGIAEDDAPPPELVSAATGAHVVISSDLPRALASARRLAPGRDISVTPLLRELELDTSGWLPLKVPIAMWDALDYVRWSYRILRRVDCAPMQRAEKAVDWLTARVGEGSTAVVVTHGSFRRLLAASFAKRGWNAGRERRSYANWSIWSFVE
jgi:broad specificity phosphatase PhoE